MAQLEGGISYLLIKAAFTNTYWTRLNGVGSYANPYHELNCEWQLIHDCLQGSPNGWRKVCYLFRHVTYCDISINPDNATWLPKLSVTRSPQIMVIKIHKEHSSTWFVCLGQRKLPTFLVTHNKRDSRRKFISLICFRVTQKIPQQSW